MWVTGDYTFNQFEETTNRHYYLANGMLACKGYLTCEDRINDLLCEPISSDSENDTILACQDRFIRFVQGSELLYDIAVDGPATVLQRYPPKKGSKTVDRYVRLVITLH